MENSWHDTFFSPRLVEYGIMRYIKKSNHNDFLFLLALSVYGSKLVIKHGLLVRTYCNPYDSTHFSI